MSHKLSNLIKSTFVNRVKMSRQELISQIMRIQQYGTKPIIEGEHVVSPPLTVPKHIVRPDYVDNPNPVFGIYNGKPVVHNKEMQQKMRKAGKVGAKVLKYIMGQVKEGVSTNDLDVLIHNYIIEQGAYPTPLGFMHFPKSVCSSVNEVLCHGIPNSRKLQNGDWINLDVTLFIDGVHGDNSGMVCVGDVHPDVQNLIKVTQKAVYESIKICRPGTPIKQIGEVCQQVAEDNGYINCELFTGHGVGEKLHMPPIVQHQKNDSPHIMEPGMVFTIEPIFMMKPGPYVMWQDDFTILSPGVPSAQWEHMVMITEDGHEVLTKRDDEDIE
ncbi:Peptidase M24, structural domain [Pseudocohnilembus persalinus]|uniref:Methionine aminopeptidase n=1 Tax=Pseudocohnilembus persalinus TaxID=266149 RepID=A0A0V0Q897_PSEPJ|nr:Peptidase M24, structural domain [Pseudocohnilembus persalinus]|eukprot:KRW98279.1 Peptidase M24, structural domain [Pseudocohnilembus persalinus]